MSASEDVRIVRRNLALLAEVSAGTLGLDAISALDHIEARVDRLNEIARSEGWSQVDIEGWVSDTALDESIA